MTIFGALAGMIRTIIRYCKKDKMIKPTNEHDSKVTTYRADTQETTNKPITNIFPKIDANEENKPPNKSTHRNSNTNKQSSNTVLFFEHCLS